ncbi:hypothetical protein HRbin11_01670 [bacterium HR11]|nr:hypothetical protein HRbin11_01670 [bacterium HR11]
MIKKLSIGLMLVGLALALLGCKKDKLHTCADEFGDVKTYCTENVQEAVESCLQDPFMGDVCVCASTGESC